MLSATDMAAVIRLLRKYLPTPAPYLANFVKFSKETTDGRKVGGEAEASAAGFSALMADQKKGKTKSKARRK